MKIGKVNTGGDDAGKNARISGGGKTDNMHYGMEGVGIHSGFKGSVKEDIEPVTERSYQEY